MFRVWADGWQEYLRSPEFLSAMAQVAGGQPEGPPTMGRASRPGATRDAGGQPPGLRPAAADAAAVRGADRGAVGGDLPPRWPTWRPACRSRKKRPPKIEPGRFMSNHNGPSSNHPGLRLPQAVVDESADFLRRVTRLPQLWARAQDVKKGATPSEVVYQEDRLRLLHYTSPAAGEVQDAAAVRLRPGESPLHPRHRRRQERGGALRPRRLRHLPGRLGRPQPRRPP